LAINPLLDAPAWLPALDRLLPQLNVSGLDVKLDGANVKVGGWLLDWERQAMLNGVKTALGPGFRYGYLRDEETELAQDSQNQTLLALMAMGADVQGADLAGVLSRWVVNFPEGGSEFPEESRDVALRSANLLRSMTHPVLMEVGGHIESRGNPTADLALSLDRANAVRDALVKAGAPAWMLKTNGYGDTKSIAAGDTAYGRFKNRRIEFTVVQPCDQAHPCGLPTPLAPATQTGGRESGTPPSSLSNTERRSRTSPRAPSATHPSGAAKAGARKSEPPSPSTTEQNRATPEATPKESKSRSQAATQTGSATGTGNKKKGSPPAKSPASSGTAKPKPPVVKRESKPATVQDLF
jgi:outer membrane protein OmpA-like peptidoglycan-associated protein